jgi:glycosyltransferase involved in cell wall biosynthesis
MNFSDNRKTTRRRADARPPRILFIGHTADMGGAEFALLRLAREIDRHRFELSAVLFSDGPLAGLLKDAGVCVEVFPLSEEVLKTSRHAAASSLFRVNAVLKTIPQIARLAKFLRDGEFDLVHSNSLKAGLIGGLAARLAGRHFLWHLHDRITSDYMPGGVARAMKVAIHHLPHFVIVNSRATLDTIEPIDRSRCAVVYPGVEVDAVPRERPLRPDGALVGLIGRISSTKGQDVFLRAASQVVSRFPGARFQVIGGALFNDHPFEREVHALASSLGLASVVEFTGFVPNVAERMAALDLVVHASPTPEPFGQVAAESMAAGKPVIATRAGGIPEIVIHEETGLLVTPGDADELAEAICRLLGDRALAARLAARGRERVVECFSIQQSARQVEQVYARLLGLSEEQDVSAGTPRRHEHLAA